MARFAKGVWNDSCFLVPERLWNVLPTKEGTMIAKQKEKWMEYCELAAKEQDPKKLIALIAEISRLLAQRADATREESATSHH
jgi:hypothetical protein